MGHDGARGFLAGGEMRPDAANSRWTLWSDERHEWLDADLTITCRESAASARAIAAADSAAPTRAGWSRGTAATAALAAGVAALALARPRGRRRSL